MVKTFDFDQNMDEPYVYKKVQENIVVFIILYIDDILLVGNYDVKLLSSIKIWLSTQFQMKDFGKRQYIFRIKILKDRKNRKLALSQATYIDKLLIKYVIFMEFHFLRISVITHLKRKSACRQYPMPQQWVSLCMQYYALNQIFVLQQVW